MTLHDKVKKFLNVELKMISPCDEQVKSSIEQGILDCGDEEAYHKEIDDWLAWTNINDAWNKTCDEAFNEALGETYNEEFPQSSFENEFDSINTFAKANPTLCCAALQAVTHIEEGLQIYLNAVTGEVEVFFEGEFMGEIAIKDGGIRVDDANFNFLNKACDHIASFFPGVWAQQ